MTDHGRARSWHRESWGAHQQICHRVTSPCSQSIPAWRTCTTVRRRKLTQAGLRRKHLRRWCSRSFSGCVSFRNLLDRRIQMPGRCRRVYNSISQIGILRTNRTFSVLCIRSHKQEKSMREKNWGMFGRREILKTSAMALGGALLGDPVEAYPKTVNTNSSPSTLKITDLRVAMVVKPGPGAQPSWVGQISANLLRDEELLDLIAASGGKWIFIGMESLDPANLASVNRRVDGAPVK